jgi:hypothetical protein
VLPRAALREAVDRWPEVGIPLLAALQDAADGTDRTDRTNSILFFGIYLIAQVRETRAFRPLCTVAADGERIFRLIGTPSPRIWRLSSRGSTTVTRHRCGC